MCIKLELIFTGRRIKLIGCIITRSELRIELQRRRKLARKISNFRIYTSSTRRY